MISMYVHTFSFIGIRLMLNTLTCALSGNYVNFGVFDLYNDKALQNSFDLSLQVCLQIPIADVLAYVKLSKAYFAFLEILFRNHLDVLSGLDSPVFIQLVKTNNEGLQSNGKYLLYVPHQFFILAIYCFIICQDALSPESVNYIFHFFFFFSTTFQLFHNSSTRFWLFYIFLLSLFCIRFDGLLSVCRYCGSHCHVLVFKSNEGESSYLAQGAFKNWQLKCAKLN